MKGPRIFKWLLLSAVATMALPLSGQSLNLDVDPSGVGVTANTPGISLRLGNHADYDDDYYQYRGRRHHHKKHHKKHHRKYRKYPRKHHSSYCGHRHPGKKHPAYRHDAPRKHRIHAPAHPVKVKKQKAKAKKIVRKVERHSRP